MVKLDIGAPMFDHVMSAADASPSTTAASLQRGIAAPAGAAPGGQAEKCRVGGARS